MIAAGVEPGCELQCGLQPQGLWLNKGGDKGS
jgi:hypothetical protein